MQLRDHLIERENQCIELEKRILRVEQELKQNEEKNRQLAQENSRIEAENIENNNLIRRMKRDLLKLQAFKKAIMETFSYEDIQDDDAGLNNALYQLTPPLGNESSQRTNSSTIGSRGTQHNTTRKQGDDKNQRTMYSSNNNTNSNGHLYVGNHTLKSKPLDGQPHYRNQPRYSGHASVRT